MTIESPQPSYFYPQLLDIDLMDSIKNDFNNPTMEKGTETILLPKFADSLSHKRFYNVPLLSNKSFKDDSNIIDRGSYSYSANAPSQESWVSLLSHQIQQQQLDDNRILIEYLEKIRMGLFEQSKIQTKRMVDVVTTRVSKKLKTKDEEIEKIKKLNWFLEAKTKSLNTENQLWREIAQNNELAANNLRINLEHLLAQRRRAAIEKDADAYSCCDSNDESEENVVEFTNRLCKNCGKDESCILILPCRHLCLCAICDFTVDNCPTCKSHIINRIPINM